jgi:hypothetical protein
VRRGKIRRIGWVIKTLEAQVGQFLLGCKRPVSRFLPGRAKDLSAPLYMHRGTFNSCSAYSTTLKTVYYFKGLCVRGITHKYVCVRVCTPEFLNYLDIIIFLQHGLNSKKLFWKSTTCIKHLINTTNIRAAQNWNMVRDSVAGIATRYKLDCPELESQWERDFPHPSSPVMGPTEPLVQWVPGLFHGSTAVKSCRWPPTPHLAPRLKKEWSYTSTPPLGLRGFF